MIKQIRRIYAPVLPGARKAELLAVLGPYLDGLYDFLFHVYGEQDAAIEVLERVLRKAHRRFRSERYQRYLRHWIFRITLETVMSHYPGYLAEHENRESVPFWYLSPEEKMAVILRDRADFSSVEIAQAMHVSEGRVGRSLAYGRESVGLHLGGADWREELKKGSQCHLVSLQARARENFSLEEKESTQAGACPACEIYFRGIEAARRHVADLPERKFDSVEASIRQSKILPLLSEPRSLRWNDLRWHTKLAVEGVALALVGLLAVVVAPRLAARIDTDALLAGRFTSVIRSDSSGGGEADEEISAERLLASAPVSSEADGMPDNTENFSDMDFPSGDFYETGAAPVAPSRQNALVYRLIVQSSNPKETAPKVREIFTDRNVKEREKSGQVLPGGVFFDGVTSVGSFPLILEGVQKLGKTKTYSNPDGRRSPAERARVIIWIQQI